MIRKMAKKDISFVMDIWLTENIKTHNFIKQEYWNKQYPFVQQAITHAEVYVYEENGEICGFIGLNGEVIEGIFIKQEKQLKGIGKAFIEFAKQEQDYLKLDVYAKNQRAIQFYQKQGFLVKAKRKDKNTNQIEYEMIWNKK